MCIATMTNTRHDPQNVQVDNYFEVQFCPCLGKGPDG